MSCLTRNITLHYLINDDNPFCLYCRNKCEIFVEAALNESHTLYKCQTCKESFQIYEMMVAITHFRFTCNDILVSIYYSTENFSLSKINSSNSTPLWIHDLDNVNFDFTNKDKLYNKMKTYLLMA